MQPSFFDGVRPIQFWIKATGLYIALLATGNEVADYSVSMSSLRDAIKAGDAVVFKLYVLWIIVSSCALLARVKVRYDLAMLRHVRRTALRKPPHRRP